MTVETPMPSAAIDAMAQQNHAQHGPAHHNPAGALLRNAVIALIAFLTVVDLFATQAILPLLAKAYRVSPAAMGFAVNASTIGMATAGLLVAAFSTEGAADLRPVLSARSDPRRLPGGDGGPLRPGRRARRRAPPNLLRNVRVKAQIEKLDARTDC
jgi:hypothetical protein